MLFHHLPESSSSGRLACSGRVGGVKILDAKSLLINLVRLGERRSPLQTVHLALMIVTNFIANVRATSLTNQ